MTLFIGVVSTAMDEATENQDENKQIEDEAERVKEKMLIPDFLFQGFREIFRLIDVDNSRTLSEEEVRLAFRLVDVRPTIEEMHEILLHAEMPVGQEDAECNFAQFVRIMMHFRQLGATGGLDAQRRRKKGKYGRRGEAANPALEKPAARPVAPAPGANGAGPDTAKKADVGSKKSALKPPGAS
jgi:hypothetical protein